MKKVKVIIFLILWVSTLQGQNTFKLNSSLNYSVRVKINKKEYLLDKSMKSVKTNFPDFDTLFFINPKKSKDPIICNFKPDSNYSITLACCDEFDIIPTSKLKNDSLEYWDFEKDHAKIKKQLLDKPFISFRLSKPTNDTIYGWYADYACIPKYKMLSENKWQYGIPQKCFYWNNISYFMFFASNKDYSEHQNEKGEIELIYPEDDEIEILDIVILRLFDDSKFILTYDLELKKSILKYE